MKEMCRKLGYFANPVFGSFNEGNIFLSIKTSSLAKLQIKIPYPETSRLKELFFSFCLSLLKCISIFLLIIGSNNRKNFDRNRKKRKKNKSLDGTFKNI